MPGFFWPNERPRPEREPMTQSFSKPRQRAESAFTKIQSQFFARDQAVEEQDFVTQAREAKTLRLREMRLAKDTDDRARATSALIRMRAKKT
jgi:hypothetical protein